MNTRQVNYAIAAIGRGYSALKMPMDTVRRCEFCGASIEHRHIDAKTCDSACRTAKYLKAKREQSHG